MDVRERKRTQNPLGGSYNAAKPKWRGVIRQGGYPVAVCIHPHPDQAHATACGRDAAKVFKAIGTYPAGYVNFDNPYS